MKPNYSPASSPPGAADAWRCMEAQLQTSQCRLADPMTYNPVNQSKKPGGEKMYIQIVCLGRTRGARQYFALTRIKIIK